MFSSAAQEFSAQGGAGGIPWGPGAASAESCTHPAKRDRCFPPPIAERQRLPNVGIYVKITQYFVHITVFKLTLRPILALVIGHNISDWDWIRVDVSHNSERCSRGSHPNWGRIFLMPSFIAISMTKYISASFWRLVNYHTFRAKLSRLRTYVLINGPLWEEFTRREWIPHTKGQ